MKKYILPTLFILSLSSNVVLCYWMSRDRKPGHFGRHSQVYIQFANAIIARADKPDRETVITVSDELAKLGVRMCWYDSSNVYFLLSSFGFDDPDQILIHNYSQTPRFIEALLAKNTNRITYKIYGLDVSGWYYWQVR